MSTFDLVGLFAGIRRAAPIVPSASVIWSDRRKVLSWWEGHFPRYTISIHQNAAISFELLVLHLLHESIHLVNDSRGISDTSREGAYHNRSFCDTAAALGLRPVRDVQNGCRLDFSDDVNWCDLLRGLSSRDLLLPSICPCGLIIWSAEVGIAICTKCGGAFVRA